MTGKSISHYEIGQKVGEGGMGSVYEAIDQHLGRRVALKFLAASRLSSSDALMRLRREARAVSTLSHPNVATLYAFEEHENAIFLVLEYLPGGTLRDALKRYPGGRVPLDLAVSWIGQMASGLGHAHRKGVIHRDIKPGNAIFDEEGRLKITDFGLAKLDEGSEITATGMTIGTAAYMAPEQAIGCGDAGPPADLFSLGVVCYEMLSGCLPFDANTQLGILHKVIHEEPLPLRSRDPAIPENLAQVVHQCLIKDPKERLDSTDEFLRALAINPVRTSPLNPRDFAAVVESSGSSRQGEEATTMVTAVRQNRRWLWIAGFVIAMVAALAAAAGFFAQWSGGVEVRKIAVLPLENVGGEESAQAFCEGLTDAMTAAVTQLHSDRSPLWVVPASELRDQQVHSAREARNAFGVNLAFTGSIRRLDEKVKVTVNLVDARVARQISTRTLDATREELSALEHRLLAALADMLDIEAGSSTGSPGTDIAAAYDRYLQGRGYLQRFDRSGHLDLAVEAFEDAVQKDPAYSLALTGLSEAYLAKYDVTRESQWLTRAQACNRRAVALDADLAPAHVNLCRLHTRSGRFDQAIVSGRRAVELDPLNAAAYRALAEAYAEAGREGDAESTYKQAIELQPGLWVAYKDLGVFYFARGRLDEAAAVFRQVIALTPDNEWGYRNLAAVYQTSGRWKEAERLLVQAVETRPTGANLSNLGTLYYSLGRYEEAAASFERAVAQLPEDPIVRGNLADAYRAVDGSQDLARMTYRQAIEIGERKLAINRSQPLLLVALAVYSAKTGEREKALAYLEEARSYSEPQLIELYQSAVVYTLTGKMDRALRTLEAAIEGGYPADEAARDPDLISLRGKPGFARLMARAKN